MTKMTNKYPMLFIMHTRKTISNPDGALAHDGDCEIYNAYLQICTCGLHHALSHCESEDIGVLYPKYTEELGGKDKVETLIRYHEED